jgi:hypothetical protein
MSWGADLFSHDNIWNSTTYKPRALVYEHLDWKGVQIIYPNQKKKNNCFEGWRESSIGVWQWFHAHSDTWIMSSWQTRRGQSEGQFGNEIQDPMLLCYSSKQHAGQSEDPVCTKVSWQKRNPWLYLCFLGAYYVAWNAHGQVNSILA